MGYTYAVVTKVGDYPGNHAICDLDLWIDGQFREGGQSIRLIDALAGGISLALALRAPVFHLGELLILDGEYGREVAGRGRKPSKWDVEVEHFSDLDKAVTRAREVAGW